MSCAASLAFPGGRTLAGWRRQLAAYGPECFWAGYVTFHRIDAPVLIQIPQKLPYLELFVLKGAVALNSGITADRLQSWLHLEPGLIHSVLSLLEREGLLVVKQHGTEVTESGHYAAIHGEYPKSCQQRRTFFFWHGDWAEPPSSRFVHLPDVAHMPLLSAPATSFAPDELRQCIGQSQDWKQQHAFPGTVIEVKCQNAGTVPSSLEEVMLATPSRCFAVVARSRSIQGTVLLGFCVNSRTWEMHAAAPAFRVPEDVPAWFPPALSMNAIRQAFIEWGQQRQLALDESQKCNLRLEGDHLVIEASSSGLCRLRGSHGESWLLAGDGLLRTALQLDFV